MKSEPLTQLSKQAQLVWFGSGVAALVALLAVIIVPTLNLGFVADDFFLLTNDQKLPLTEAADQLHRPLRNVFLRILGSRLGLDDVLPYRVLVTASFVAVLVLFFLFLRRTGVSRLGSLAAVFVLALFPRNHEVLYWFAAWQDLIAAAAILATCVFFLGYRQTSRPYHLLLAAVSYAVALGFKETSFFLPAVLLSLDVFRERKIPRFSNRGFWQAYVPLACVMVMYVAYFLIDAGFASLAGHRTGGYYKFPGVRYVISGLMRSLANIAVAFSQPFTLTDIRRWQAALVLIEFGLLLLLAHWLRQWRAILLAASWFLCMILPTAVFAASMNADRYLFVPAMGFFLLLGFFVDALLARPEGARYWLAICAALTLFAALSVPRLIGVREQWRSGGAEADVIVREIMSLSAGMPANSDVYFVNVTHSQPTHKPVFANGLSEALHASGFPFSARIERNLAASDDGQQRLVASLRHCQITSASSDDKRTMLIELNGHMRRLNSACAFPFVDQDRNERPLAWALVYPER